MNKLNIFKKSVLLLIILSVLIYSAIYIKKRISGKKVHNLYSLGTVTGTGYNIFSLKKGLMPTLTVTSGVKELLFLIDTGAEISAIPENSEHITGISEEIRIIGISKVRNKRPVAILNPFNFGNFEVKNLSCIVVDNPFFYSDGVVYDGVLGENFLNKFTLILDYPNESFSMTIGESIIEKNQFSVPMRSGNYVGKYIQCSIRGKRISSSDRYWSSFYSNT